MSYQKTLYLYGKKKLANHCGENIGITCPISPMFRERIPSVERVKRKSFFSNHSALKFKKPAKRHPQMIQREAIWN